MKAIPWQENAETLLRIEKSYVLWLHGTTYRDIGEQMGVSRHTSWKDVKRAKDLLRTQAADTFATIALDAVEQYRQVAADAWKRLDVLPQDSGIAPALHAQIRGATTDQLTVITRASDVANTQANRAVISAKLDELTKEDLMALASPEVQARYKASLLLTVPATSRD